MDKRSRYISYPTDENGQPTLEQIKKAAEMIRNGKIKGVYANEGGKLVTVSADEIKGLVSQHGIEMI